MKALSILLALYGSLNAQSYPRWFLEPIGLTCGPTACGYVTPSFYRSSSDSAAFLNGCENLAHQHFAEISGGESYWETEAGVYWMGNDFKEKIDSSYLAECISKANRAAVFAIPGIELVLVSERDCIIPDSMSKVVRCSGKSPAWVDTIPDVPGYIYATGVAPQYFYESSSWESAEKKAHFNLAREMKVSLKALQKVDQSSGQEIRSEEISGSVSKMEVVYRWRDVRQGLYLVLMRAPSE